MMAGSKTAAPSAAAPSVADAFTMRPMVVREVVRIAKQSGTIWYHPDIMAQARELASAAHHAARDWAEGAGKAQLSNIAESHTGCPLAQD